MSDEILREVASLLFGDGSDEIVSKLAPTAEQKDRRKRALTAGLSGVGATAGAAGLGLAGSELYHGRKAAIAAGAAKPLRTAVKSKKFATALVPLEVAGLGGELMATKILHGDTKKKVVRFDRDVSKSEPGSSDLHIPTTGKLKRMAADKAIREGRKRAPTLKRGALKVLNQTPKLDAKVEQHGKKVSKSITWEGEISKVNADKRQVFGWASIVEMDGEPVVDLQGDYIDIDEIEKSAYDYVVKSRKGGEMHRRNGDAPVHVSDMIESLVVTPEKKAALGLPEDTPTGWWVGYQINDDEAWNLVKSGKRTGFSIHGRGQRTQTEI